MKTPLSRQGNQGPQNVHSAAPHSAAAAGRLLSDGERMQFLRALDATERVELSDWEAKFIDTAFRYQTGAVRFSESQRQVIELMAEKYGGRL